MKLTVLAAFVKNLIIERFQFLSKCYPLCYFVNGLVPSFSRFCLRTFFPMAMMFQTIGVQCLLHIVREISPSELRWFGRDDLISDALLNMVTFSY